MSFDAYESFGKGALIGGGGYLVALLFTAFVFHQSVSDYFPVVMGVSAGVGGVINVLMRS